MLQNSAVTACILVNPAYVLPSAPAMADLHVWAGTALFFHGVIVGKKGLRFFGVFHFLEGRCMDIAQFIGVKAIEVARVDISVSFNNVGNLASAEHPALVRRHTF